MRTIQVKVVPATNTKPMRLKATVYGGKPMTVGYQYDDTDREAAQLARALLERELPRFAHHGLLAGVLPNGDYAFTIVNPKDIELV